MCMNLFDLVITNRTYRLFVLHIFFTNYFTFNFHLHTCMPATLYLSLSLFCRFPSPSLLSLPPPLSFFLSLSFFLLIYTLSSCDTALSPIEVLTTVSTTVLRGAASPDPLHLPCGEVLVGFLPLLASKLCRLPHLVSSLPGAERCVSEEPHTPRN